MNILAVFIGGGLGSLMRYLLTVSTKNLFFFYLPVGTFLSNIISSLILGLVVGYLLIQNSQNEFLRYFLIIGICGGFSTFSSFGFENYSFIEQNQLTSFFLYSVLSVLFSIMMIFLGIFLSKNLL